MALPQWSQEFVLGNKTIDDEHQRLMVHLTSLEAQLLDEQPLDLRAVTALVSELNAHVEDHFRHEEVLMATLPNMPEEEREAHRRDHARWRQRILDHLGPLSLAATDLELRAHLARTLLVGKSFWTEHFQTFDRRIQDFLGA